MPCSPPGSTASARRAGRCVEPARGHRPGLRRDARSQHLAAESLRHECWRSWPRSSTSSLVRADSSRSPRRTRSLPSRPHPRHRLRGDASSARGRRSTRVRRVGRGVNRDGATEYEEILGYHLEQAYRYLSRARPLDETGGGRRARARGTPRRGGDRAADRRRRSGCREPASGARPTLTESGDLHRDRLLPEEAVRCSADPASSTERTRS